MVFSFPTVYRGHALTVPLRQWLWCSRLIAKIHSASVEPSLEGGEKCDLCYLTPDELRTGYWHLDQITPVLRGNGDKKGRALACGWIFPNSNWLSSFEVKRCTHLSRMICSWKGSESTACCILAIAGGHFNGCTIFAIDRYLILFMRNHSAGSSCFCVPTKVQPCTCHPDASQAVIWVLPQTITVT